MKIRNLKIGLQLSIGLSALMLMVVFLGLISSRHTRQIHQQTKLLYDHPLQVRNAIGQIHSDVHLIHWALETALSYKTYEEMIPFIQIIGAGDARIQGNLEVLYQRFLGSKESIDRLKQITADCRENRDQVIHLILAGNLEAAARINIHSGSVIGSAHLEEILSEVKVISDYAHFRASSLMEASIDLRKALDVRLILFTLIILLISFLIYYMFMYHIHRPLVELTNSTRLFEAGDTDVRNEYTSNSELGHLSSAFNSLADGIQANLALNEQYAVLAAKMLSEDDARQFFQNTLQVLIEYTSSQLAAVYLHSDDGTTYEHFVSIGLDDAAKASFSANGLEGEFGPAIASWEIQHIQQVPPTTRFIFNTVSGAFIPHEIITLPIFSGDDVIAIISLASLHQYTPEALALIKRIHPVYCARVEGILAFHKTTELTRRLEIQNNELEAQKAELTMQSSELTEQNRELEIQKHQLDEVNRLKTSFLSNMSHELRTPLNSVIALSGVLYRRLQNQIPTEEHNYLEIIERNGKHLLSLINDILDIARVESGREELEIKSFRICDCINEVIEMIHAQAQGKGLSLHLSGGDCHAVITSDASKIAHIMQNLIANAVKFTEAGSVTVSVTEIEDAVNIVVTDTGMGIAQEHLEHIFDEFRQADGGTSRKYGGTGLGLSIARKYARLLGGDISVKSVVGEGSAFTLSLPLEYAGVYTEMEKDAGSAFPNAANVNRMKRVESLKTRTILVVDDSEPALIQIQDILEENAFKVLLARDGMQALDILSATIPDAIVLDLMMPEIDGFRVLKSIRENPSTAQIPVLILTAKHISRQELSFLKQNKVYQLIQKGDVKREELLASIHGMIPEEKSVDSPRGSQEDRLRAEKIKGKPVVLVVEDNPDNMISIEALLKEDFMVLKASHGLEALEMAGANKPDVILMDISLPGMDGIEVFRAIREDEQLKHIPVIAVTASALTSEKAQILAQGFDAFIAKPIDDNFFHSTIREVIYGRGKY